MPSAARQACLRLEISLRLSLWESASLDLLHDGCLDFRLVVDAVSEELDRGKPHGGHLLLHVSVDIVFVEERLELGVHGRHSEGGGSCDRCTL